MTYTPTLSMSATVSVEAAPQLVIPSQTESITPTVTRRRPSITASQTVTITQTSTVESIATKESIATPTVEEVNTPPITNDVFDVDALINELNTSNQPPEQIITQVRRIIASGLLTPPRALELVSNMQVVTNITAPEAAILYELVKNESLNQSQITALTDAIQNAPMDIRDTFEQTMDLYGIGFDTYVPLGSRVPIGTRRALVVISMVSMVLSGMHSRSQGITRKKDD